MPVEHMRRYLKITYGEPSFFPSPVKFGFINSEGKELNAKLIFLEYGENRMMAEGFDFSAEVCGQAVVFLL